MPTPVAAARQCLSPPAAAALDSAVAAARRRSHAQTTSLHLIASLLATGGGGGGGGPPPPPPLLRDALARARSSTCSPRLQLKALELCFSVSLDRLPSAAGGSGCGEEPPVSNSLMAAIKRSQANQRRNPDTYHLYHQSISSSPSAAAAVKVELPQLVLAILDDPVVSRVFAEAGFRSSDIKLAILRPAPPPLLRFPRHRPPPLFLCSFAAADDDAAASASSSSGGGGDENCRRIADLLSRGRNPMLVGVGASAAAADFSSSVAASGRSFLTADPDALHLLEPAAAAGGVETLGLVISIGDLKELLEEGGEEKASRVVAEVTRVLELHKSRVWVMGWSATYETYLKFLSKFPLLDKDWELQLLPITSVRIGAPAGSEVLPASGVGPAFSKPPSLIESFVPFGGFFPETYGPNSLVVTTPYPSTLRCPYCNDKYEQEAVTILRGSGATVEDQDDGNLPSWLQKVSTVGMHDGFEAVKVKDDKMVLNSKIMNLQKKWNDYCLRLHQGSQRIERDGFRLFPQYAGLPSDSERVTSQHKNADGNGLQRDGGNSSSSMQNNTTIQRVVLPSVSKPWNDDLISKLQVTNSKSELLQERGLQFRQGDLPDLRDNEDYASPSSVASVATDLVLGTPREPHSNEETPTRKYTEDLQKSSCLQTQKMEDSNRKVPQLPVQSYSCSQSSTNVIRPIPRPLNSTASEGVSAFGQWNRSPSCVIQKPDQSNYKLLCESLYRKVGRQEEALSAISRAVVQCRTGERCRGASRKGDIWLSFHGPDYIAKRRAAVALAELLCDGKEDLVCLDLSHQDGIACPNTIYDKQEVSGYDLIFRGKTSVDCIAGELSKKPRSIIFLDNVDKADFLVQNSLSHAMQTGKFPDSHGREYNINNSIFVLSTRMIRRGKDLSAKEEDCTFSEERILAARGLPMKILVESSPVAVSSSPNAKAVATPRHDSRSIQASLFSRSLSKRKLIVSGNQEGLQEPSGASKRLHRTPSALFDLNLPVDEVEPRDTDSSSGSTSGGSHDNNSSLDNSEAWAENLFDSVDGAINFEPCNFDSAANDILKDVSKIVRSILGSNCVLEIDDVAMEQILAAASISEDKSLLDSWLDQVLGRSLAELKPKCKFSNTAFLRLVACEDALVKEQTLGVLLPSRLFLD